MAKKDIGKLTGEPVTFQIRTPAGGVQMETFIPWTLVKRGVRRQVITPLDAPEEFHSEAFRERLEATSTKPTALLRALGLAHHWQRLLDEERLTSITEIAEIEGMDVTQVRRLLRLALLAPSLIEQFAGGGAVVLEQVLRRPWPNDWADQRTMAATLRSPN